MPIKRKTGMKCKAIFKERQEELLREVTQLLRSNYHN